MVIRLVAKTQIVYALDFDWMPSDEIVVDMHRFIHYTVYGLLETARQDGKRR
jgi:hypothetical protein